MVVVGLSLSLTIRGVRVFEIALRVELGIGADFWEGDVTKHFTAKKRGFQ